MDWNWREMDITYPCLHLASVIDQMILLLHLTEMYRALHERIGHKNLFHNKK